MVVANANGHQKQLEPVSRSMDMGGGTVRIFFFVAENRFFFAKAFSF
jgi:hypothetical protein